jgi:hypothetical protein
MTWKVFALENGSDDWVVQATTAAGNLRIYRTIFTGAGAEARAYEYFRWVCSRTSATAA